MRTALARWKAFYGANPLHLLALLGSFAIAGYAVLHLVDDRLFVKMVVWFVGAIIGHDLILFPLYALADRSLTGALKVLRPQRTGGKPSVSPVNYLRLPLLGTGLTFLLFFPGIIRQGADTYQAATGLTQEPFLNRWLLLTAAMFAASALAYAIRLSHAQAPVRAAKRAARGVIRPGERVLEVAARPGNPPEAIGTNEALYYNDPQSSWCRFAWEDLGNFRWHEADRTLVVRAIDEATALDRTLVLPAPRGLPELVRTMITSTSVATRRIELGEAGHALLIVSRRPATGELVWRVHHSNGTDDDPEVHDRITAAITELSEELDLPRVTLNPQH